MDLGKVGLILPGGGFKCAFQVGALQAFHEAGINFEVAQGISGGALNVAKYFESGPAALKEEWMDIERRGPHAVFDGYFLAATHALLGQNALHSDEGLNRLISRLDVEKILNHPVLIEIVVFNETLDRLQVIRNHDLKDNPNRRLILEYISSSARFAGIFRPVCIDGQVFSDGCEWVLHPDCTRKDEKVSPFAKCDTIFVIDVNQPHQVEEPTDLMKLNFITRIVRRTNSLIDNSSEKELNMFAGENNFKIFPKQIIEKSPFWLRFLGSLVDRPVHKLIVVIKPEQNIENLRMDSFNKKYRDITTSVNHGHERTKEVIGMLEVGK